MPVARGRRGIPLVLVSHDVSVVSRHVDRIVCVNVSVDEHPAAAIEGKPPRQLPAAPEGLRLSGRSPWRTEANLAVPPGT